MSCTFKNLILAHAVMSVICLWSLMFCLNTYPPRSRTSDKSITFANTVLSHKENEHTMSLIIIHNKKLILIFSRIPCHFAPSHRTMVNLAGTIDNSGLSCWKSHKKLCESLKQMCKNRMQLLLNNLLMFVIQYDDSNHKFYLIFVTYFKTKCFWPLYFVLVTLGTCDCEQW